MCVLLNIVIWIQKRCDYDWRDSYESWLLWRTKIMWVVVSIQLVMVSIWPISVAHTLVWHHHTRTYVWHHHTHTYVWHHMCVLLDIVIWIYDDLIITGRSRTSHPCHAWLHCESDFLLFRFNLSCYSESSWMTGVMCMSHVTHMNQSCRTRGWVLPHIWMYGQSCRHSHVGQHGWQES